MLVFAALLMLFFTIYTVTRTKPMDAVFGRTAMSTAAVLLFVLAAAFDVAIVEALLGVFLSTFLYITIFKRTGTLRVGFISSEGLFQRSEAGYSGKVYELLIGFAREYKYEIQLVEYGGFEEMLRAIREDYIGIAFGPIEVSILPQLEKNFYVIRLPSPSGATHAIMFERSKEFADKLLSYYEGIFGPGETVNVDKVRGDHL
ncbi:hydrogenase subunit MbhD domain-containing protein [Pseudothermotoga sp.]